MKAAYKRETLPDPASEGKTYDSFALERDVEFCCDAFKNHCKKFTGWSYDDGKFGIVDKITYEGHSVSLIDYCPFCGENIEYEDVENPKKTRKQKR